MSSSLNRLQQNKKIKSEIIIARKSTSNISSQQEDSDTNNENNHLIKKRWSFNNSKDLSQLYSKSGVRPLVLSPLSKRKLDSNNNNNNNKVTLTADIDHEEEKVDVDDIKKIQGGSTEEKCIIINNNNNQLSGTGSGKKKKFFKSKDVNVNVNVTKTNCTNSSDYESTSNYSASNNSNSISNYSNNSKCSSGSSGGGSGDTENSSVDVYAKVDPPVFPPDYFAFKRNSIISSQKRNDNKIDYLTQVIPNELILKILSYVKPNKKDLKSCLQVNKKLNQITKDESLWRCIDLINKNINSFSNLDIIINQRRPWFLRLNKCCFDFEFEYDFENNKLIKTGEESEKEEEEEVSSTVGAAENLIVKSPSQVKEEELLEEKEKDNKNLRYLDLSMIEINNNINIVTYILNKNQFITKLSLEHLNLKFESKLFTHGLNNLAKNGTLSILNLSMCYNLDYKVFCNFLNIYNEIEKDSSLAQSNYGKLKELNISNLKTNWNGETLLEIIKVLPKSLERLNLGGYKYIRDTHVTILAQRLENSNLIELDISDAHKITMLSLESIITYLKSLNTLSLNRCYEIEPSSYILLLNLTKLEYLNLFSLFKAESLGLLSNYLNHKDKNKKEKEKDNSKIKLNQQYFSTVARPTCGIKRSSIWDVRLRD